MSFGRPTKLTPEMQAEICELLEDGCGRDDASESVGIHRATFYEWMAKGEDGDSIYADFADAIKRAESKCAARNVKIVRKAAEEEGNWQAAAWWLERKRKKEFGRNESIEHTGAAGGAIKIESKNDGPIPITEQDRMAEIIALADAARARADQASLLSAVDELHPPSTDPTAS